MSPSAPGELVRFVDHDSMRVILLDFEGITEPAQALAAVAEAKEFFGRLRPDGSHYTLTDVRNTRYDRRIIDALKDLTNHNRPYVHAAAVISNSAIHRAAISMMSMFSRRRFGVFDTREQGLDYLAAEHAAKPRSRVGVS